MLYNMSFFEGLKVFAKDGTVTLPGTQLTSVAEPLWTTMANVHGVVHRAKLHDKTSVTSHLAVPMVSGKGCRHFVWNSVSSATILF